MFNMEARKSIIVDPATHAKLKRAALGGATIGQLVKALVDQFLKAVK